MVNLIVFLLNSVFALMMFVVAVVIWLPMKGFESINWLWRKLLGLDT